MIAIPRPTISTGRFDFAKRTPGENRGGVLLPLIRWLSVVTPTYTWNAPHLLQIQTQLNKVTSGEINRLMLFIPPRHGKSELSTIRYPVYRLEIDPTLKVIIGAYNQTLANKFSRKARRIAAARLSLSRDRTAVEDWENTQGGGIRAVGVGGGITGQGGNLIVIDDPIKNREEANSPTYRERVWEWYTDDLYTRLEPGGAIILIMTRWHEDDLAGRILASDDGDGWTVVNFPALAETHDILGRSPGQALWPQRFDEVALDSIKTVLGNSFYALYQQRPQPPEGGMFKRAYFDIVEALPAGCKFVRYWDKAGTKDAGVNRAYTAGVLMAYHQKSGLFYVVDVVMGQWEAGERESIIKQTAILDRGMHGNVAIWSEQEPGSGGKESAQSTVRMLAGYSVYTDRVTGDKATRAEPMAAQAMARNIKLLAGKWNNRYLDIITSFPYGTIKDPVDASSGAFNKLANVPGPIPKDQPTAPSRWASGQTANWRRY